MIRGLFTGLGLALGLGWLCSVGREWQAKQQADLWFRAADRARKYARRDAAWRKIKP